MNRLCAAILLLVACLSTECRAGFFVEIKNAVPSSYFAGQSGIFEVWGRHDEVGTITLNSFTLAFDLPTAGMFSAVSGSNAITGAVIASSPTTPPFTPSNYDFGFRTTTGGTGQVLNSGQSYKLFDISFTVSGSAPIGTHNLLFKDDALNIVGAGPGTSAANSVVRAVGASYINPTTPGRILQATPSVGFQGQFTITAVPEPSSLALVGLVGFGMGLYRRRRS